MEEVAGSVPTFVTAIVQLGLSVSLCVFFVYRDYKREQSNQLRTTALETFQRETLVKLSEESTKQLALSTQAMNRMSDVCDRLERKS